MFSNRFRSSRANDESRGRSGRDRENFETKRGETREFSRDRGRAKQSERSVRNRSERDDR